MKIRYKLFFLALVVCSLKACYYDVEEELYPYTSLEDVTYSGNIAPIISTNCLACHSSSTYLVSGSGIILETYDDLKKQVDNGKFPCVVNHESGCSQMPKGGSKLNANLLAQINAWVADGAPNN